MEKLKQILSCVFIIAVLCTASFFSGIYYDSKDRASELENSISEFEQLNEERNRYIRELEGQLRSASRGIGEVIQGFSDMEEQSRRIAEGNRQDSIAADSLARGLRQDRETVEGLITGIDHYLSQVETQD